MNINELTDDQIVYLFNEWCSENKYDDYFYDKTALFEIFFPKIHQGSDQYSFIVNNIDLSDYFQLDTYFEITRPQNGLRDEIRTYYPEFVEWLVNKEI